MFCFFHPGSQCVAHKVHNSDNCFCLLSADIGFKERILKFSFLIWLDFSPQNGRTGFCCILYCIVLI